MFLRFLFLACMLGFAVSLILAALTLFYFYDSSLLGGALIGGGILSIPFVPLYIMDRKALGYFKKMSLCPTWLQGIVACTNLGMVFVLLVGLIFPSIILATVPFLVAAALYATASILYYPQQHRLKYDIDHLRTR